MRNADTNNADWMFQFPETTNLGDKKLYIKGIRRHMYDSDATNYIDTIKLYGVTESAATLLHTWTCNTDKTVGEKTETFTAVDCSGYNYVILWVTCLLGAANALEYLVEVHRYYG